MSLVLNLEILGEYKNLTAATKGATGQLQGLNKKASAISANIGRAFAAIGIGLSFKVITRELEEATKAAVEDTKSQELLALAMKNTGKATDANVASAEKIINRMQFSAAVADDQLRPAYQKLFIATGSVTDSQRLLQIALDASAATGKGLDVVSQAMAKSLAGSDTALLKLIPSLKGAKDPIAALESAFAGASAAAADTDPYARMQVLFGEMQEQIGMVLLPTLQQFSTWLSTPEGQKKLQAIVDGIKEVLAGFIGLTQWIADNKGWLLPMIGAIAGLTAGWKLATVAVEAFKTAALIAAAIGTGGAAFGAAAAGAGVGGFQQGVVAGQTAQIYGGTGDVSKPGGKLFGSAFQPPKTAAKSTTNNITVQVKNVTDAKTIIKEVKGFQNSSGVSLGKALIY